MTLPSDYLFRKLGGKLGKKLVEKRPRGLVVWRSSSMAWMNTTATIKSWSHISNSYKGAVHQALRI